MLTLAEFFETGRKIVDQKLDDLIPGADKPPSRLHEAVRWSVFAGGKRFRPVLLLAVGQVFDADFAKLESTGAAIELVHTYSLIHDDLPAMDDDNLRRGRETCHIKFDEATAILAGDVLQTLAFKALADDVSLSAEQRLVLISGLAEAAGTPLGMVAGQQFDIDSEGKDISGDKLERIHRCKTGAMILFSAKAGAQIGGATALEIESISIYAAKIGLLFQITDDLLDITQSSAVLGKTAGKDQKSAKATYPSIYGSSEARNMANKMHRDALDALEGIDRDKRILLEIADFILNRTS